MKSSTSEQDLSVTLALRQKALCAYVVTIILDCIIYKGFLYQASGKVTELGMFTNYIINFQMVNTVCLSTQI